MNNKPFDKDGVRADVAVVIIIICLLISTVGLAILKLIIK
jgi:hypothetical protein